MGLALFKERRMTERIKLIGLLPGRLVTVDRQQNINCRPIDISEHGLGIVSHDVMPVGQELELIIGDSVVINLMVAWEKDDFSKQDMKRYGLVATNENINLLDIFAKNKCITT